MVSQAHQTLINPSSAQAKSINQEALLATIKSAALSLSLGVSHTTTNPLAAIKSPSIQAVHRSPLHCTASQGVSSASLTVPTCNLQFHGFTKQISSSIDHADNNHQRPTLVFSDP
jgi:hypothetical protein